MMTMKNTVLLHVTPALATDRLVNATQSSTTRCLNLRPDVAGHGMVPVGRPAVADALPAAEAPAYAIPAELNSITIRCRKHTDVSAELPAMVLQGEYIRCSGSLDGSDSERLSEQLIAAYTQLARHAAANGSGLQPRLMAWRLTDGDGRVMARSVPMLACVPDTPFAASGPLTAALTKDSGGNFSQMATTTVSAATYRVNIELPDLTMTDHKIRQAASRLDILATPPLHPVDFKAVARTRLTAVDSAHGQLTAYMPGTAEGMSPRSVQRYRLIENVLHRFHELARVVHSVTRPIADGTPRVIDVPLYDTSTPADAVKAVEHALSKPVTVLSHDLKARCSAPNSFTAQTWLISGDTLISGDITPHRFCGYMPDTYAADSEPATGFRQLTKTEIAGSGEVTVAHSRTAGSGAMPTRVSALVVSPHPDATSMTMRVCGADGSVRELTLALTQSPCGRYAYHIAADLLPQELAPADSDYVIPATVAKDTPTANAIMASPADAPYSITGHCITGRGVIHRITRSTGSASAWNFARQHLLVWASDGIYSLSVNSSRTTLGATQLHPTGVARADAVASSPWAIYGALTDGSVCFITGSRVTPLIRAGTAAAIGYEPVRHELWIKQTDGMETLVMPLPACSGHYSRSEPVIAKFHDAPGRLYATGTDGHILDLGAETEDREPVAVEYSARIPTGLQPGCRMKMLRWDIQSAHADLTTALRTDSGAGAANSYPLISLTTGGPVNAPLRARMAVRPGPWLTFTAQGLCDRDTRMGTLTAEAALPLK